MPLFISKKGWGSYGKKLLLLLLLGLTVVGCATAEKGRKISPEEPTWIKKGITTRTEVVEKLGPSMSGMPH
jgi:hypothetical protein